MHKKAILKQGKETAIIRKHPWIFSGAIKSIEPCNSGDLIEVFNSNGDSLGIAYVSNGSIALRMLSFEPCKINVSFWEDRIRNSSLVRQACHLGWNTSTNAYRLIHGEGDGIPGLVVDVYDNNIVVQAHTDGIFNLLEDIAEALKNVFGKKLERIYSKSKAAMHDDTVEDGYLLGNPPTNPVIVKENDYQFFINWETGQKTGFFLDQRDNRNLLRQYSEGKTVLNTFSYSGGFSISALAGNAKSAISVDISEKAIALANENGNLNGFEDRHEGICADVLEYLKDESHDYDIVILDPPAFAKSIKKKHSATMGYKRLNHLGIQRVKPGGLLFTFSCSQVIDPVLFENTVRAAAIERGRNARVLHRLNQGADHPVNLFHPEGHYLKGLVLVVD